MTPKHCNRDRNQSEEVTISSLISLPTKQGLPECYLILQLFNMPRAIRISKVCFADAMHFPINT